MFCSFFILSFVKILSIDRIYWNLLYNSVNNRRIQWRKPQYCTSVRSKVIGYFKIVYFQKYATLQEDYYSLKERCLEQEQAMEELGTELSCSKLQVADLQEEAVRNKAEGTWAEDKGVTNCKTCKKEFNMTRRRVNTKH